MTSMSEAVTRLRKSEDLIIAGMRQLEGVSPDLADLHAQAWKYAGGDDSQARAARGQVKNHENFIRNLIEQIRTHYRDMETATKQAIEAVERADAERKTQRARLKV